VPAPDLAHLRQKAVPAPAKMLPGARSAGFASFMFIVFMSKHIHPFLEFLRYI
jgi:hypothetical protein